MIRRTGILLLLALPCLADTVTLKSGKTLEGRLIDNKDNWVSFETYADGELKIATADIRSIRKGPSKFDDYDARAKDSPDTAEGHFALGNWCRTQGLLRRADAEWLKAVEKEPDHSGARKALGHVKRDGKWLTEDEAKTSDGYVKVKGKWIKRAEYDRIRLANAVECKIRVGVKPDASKEFLEGLKKKIEESAKMVWKCTEGQMYISEAHIVDRRDKGDVIINNLDSHLCDGSAYGRTDGSQIFLGGKFPVVTFCHEWGHLKFGLPEEYIEPKCGNCVMEPWKGVFEFCDKGNHTAKGEDCWSTILKRYKNWRHPNADYGECPPLKVTVEDK